MLIPEKEVLRSSLKILRTVFKQWVRVERRTSGLFRNPGGHTVRIGKVSEADIGGWVLKGDYIAKPIAIEVKNSDFRPGHGSKVDKKRFMDQCRFLQDVNHQGGIGFWINNPGHLYTILMPVLIHGARVTIDVNRCVVVTWDRDDPVDPRILSSLK